MYTLHTTPVEWEEAYVLDYLDKLLWYWTSYSSRLEFEALMISELNEPPEIARLMAIALMRATVEPKIDPEKAPPDPKQEPLWHWDLPWPPQTGVPTSGVVGHMSLPTPGGSITITQHGELLRVRFEIATRRTANGWHSIAMQGFCRPLGYSVSKFLEMMQIRSQEPLQTDDPDSQLNFEEILHASAGEDDADLPGDTSGDVVPPCDPGPTTTTEGGQN
jgi:hypothetical protein